MPSSTDPPADRLHDGAQQSVTAVRLLAESALAALRDGDAAAASAALERLLAAADQAAAEIAVEVERLREEAAAAVGVLGQSGWDVVTAPGLDAERRIGGSPIYASRALGAAGAKAVVIVKGVGVPGAAAVLEGAPFRSVLVHSDAGTEHELAAVGEPFTADEIRRLVLPHLDGVGWVVLGGQSSTDFPPDALAALVEAGLHVCLDAQGLARGPDPGPVRLRPFGPEAVAGVQVLKLGAAEARAVCGGTEPEQLRALGVPEVALTLGGEGAVLVTPRAVERVSAGEGTYTDPTGAGDSWLAAYALGRARGLSPGPAARAAARSVDALYLAQPAG